MRTPSSQLTAIRAINRCISSDAWPMTSPFVINKFSGDPRLFDDGYAFVAERIGWPRFGVVPWFPKAQLLSAEGAQTIGPVPTISARHHRGGGLADDDRKDHVAGSWHARRSSQIRR